MGILTGKVAIVTGASKGIGAGIAKGLGEAGASVVVNYFDDGKDSGQPVVDAITKAGGKAIAIKGDVSNPADAQTIVDTAIANFGRLDVLVNNAGVYELRPIESITPEHFHQHFNVNVLGMLLVTQAAVKHIGKGGSIINIGSVGSRITPAGSSAYTGTKGAVDAITRVLSKEFGPRGIRVNALNPGLVETEGTHAGGFVNSDFQKQHVAAVPLGRVGQPKDIADVAVFLASDQAGWLTGELINASGGIH